MWNINFMGKFCDLNIIQYLLILFVRWFLVKQKKRLVIIGRRVCVCKLCVLVNGYKIEIDLDKYD